MLESYRPLIGLWTAILSLSMIGAAALQILGPPAGRGLRQDRPQTMPSPPARHADPPVAAASLALPASVELPALGPLAPPVPAQPSHRRARSWVRKGVAPARMPSDLGIGDDSILAKRGEPASRSELWPRDRDALPSQATPSLPSRPSAYQHVAGYIGVFTMGADGTRVFRATP